MNAAADALHLEQPPREVAIQRSRILLVDDHAILRHGLRALLEIEPDLEIIAEAGNHADALEHVKNFSPALIITDLVLPGSSGLDLIRSAREICPGVRIIVLTAHNSEEYIRAALDVFVNGYVLKDASRAELLSAIHMVMAGHQFLCRNVTERIVSGYLHGSDGPKPAGDIRNTITSREREVLTRVALGQANKTIARYLGLSVKTVEKHRSNLMRKLQLHNSAGITRFALFHHLISVDEVAARTTSAD